MCGVVHVCGRACVCVCAHARVYMSARARACVCMQPLGNISILVMDDGGAS